MIHKKYNPRSAKSGFDLVVLTLILGALSSLLCLVDSGLMEKDAPIAPMTMGVKEPGAF